MRDWKCGTGKWKIGKCRTKNAGVEYAGLKIQDLENALSTRAFFPCICVFLQCFDTVGWVIWPVKTRPRYDLLCVWWDVKPCSTQLRSCILLPWKSGPLFSSRVGRSLIYLVLIGPSLSGPAFSVDPYDLRWYSERVLSQNALKKGIAALDSESFACVTSRGHSNNWILVKHLKTS